MKSHDEPDFGPLTEMVFASDLPGLRTELETGADPEEQDSDQRTPLIHAAIDDKVEFARVLIEQGANVNVQDRFGFTALHYAAQEHLVQMVRLLLGSGITLETEDMFGNTALWRAASESRGRGEVIRALLKAGADPHHQNKNGMSARDVANSICNYDVAKWFASTL